MKKGIVRLWKIAAALLCVVLLSVSVFAAKEDTNSKGIAIQLSTPKETYKAGEELGVRLNIINYSTGTLTGNYTVTLPDGMTLTGTPVGQVNVVGGSNQAVILGNFPEKGYIFSADDVETVAEFDDEGYTDLPVQTAPTGDSFALGLWIAVAAISGAGLVVLIVTHRKARAYLALLLCLCTLLPMLPAVEVDAAAASTETVVLNTSKTVKIDGKEYTISASVEVANELAADADPYLYKAVDGAVVLEAEDVYVDNDNFVIHDMDCASGKKAVYFAKSAGNLLYEIEAINERQMGFDFIADEAGTYNLWARAWVPNNHITIYRSLNGAPYRSMQMYNNGVSADKTDLIWEKIGNVRVEKGEVVEVNLRTRVNHCYIDKFIVTSNQAYIPQGADAVPPVADWYSALEFDTELYADPKVYPTVGDHPRLFFHQDEVEEIRDKFYDPLNAEVAKALCETAAMNFDGVWDIENESNYKATDLGIIECKAFYYAIFKNDPDPETRERAIKYAKQAIVAIKHCQETVTYDGNPLRVNGHVMYVTALVYDWCYDILTQKDKARLAAGGQVMGNGMEIGFPPTIQEAVNGHGAEKQLLRDWLAFSIAVYDEFPSIYELVGGRFFEEYVPARNKYWATSQYHYQGSSYGAYRSVADIMGQILIYRMADVDYADDPNFVYDEGFNQLAYQWMYSRRPDERYMRDGDGGSIYTVLDRYGLLYYAAMLYKDPVLYEEFLSNVGTLSTYSYAENLTPAMILTLQDRSVGTVEKDVLPYTKYHGSPYGMLVARTGFEFSNLYSNDVIANMKIQESYVGGHQNREAGSFQIYYKGMLTGDSGYYGNFGTDHDTTYQSQSISKNTLVITSTANPNGYQTSLEDTKNPGNSGTVLGVEYGNNIYRPEYSYISGDVAKAYDDNVQEAVRNMLFLNLNLDGYTESPGALIVLDQIKTTEANSKKTFLLHTHAEPRITDSSIITVESTESGYNGRLTNQVLYVGTADKADANYTVHSIGGEGKEFWVGDIGTGDNHPNEREPVSVNEAGWGRVEITTTAAAENQTDYMLNVMYVSKANGTNAVIPATMVRGTGLMGAQILGHVAMFNMNGNNRISDTTSFQIPAAEGYSEFEVNVAGMKAGTWQVTAGNNSFEVVATQEGGMLYFTAPAGTVTMSYIAEPVITAEGVEETRGKFDTTAPEVPVLNKMYVNDLLLDVETAPYVDGNTVMVPLTSTMSTVNAVVDWRNSTIAIKYMNENELTINGKVKTVYLNGEKIKTTIKYDEDLQELWVPISVVNELLGEYGSIAWSAASNLLIINAESGVNLKPIPETYLADYPSAIQVADAKTLGHVSNYNEIDYGILSSLDGNEETRFVGSSNPTEGWQFEGVYDLGAPQTLDKLMIYFNSTSDKRQYLFDVLVSLDGEEYTLVLDRARSGGENEFEPYDIPDQEVRYVKIKGYKGYMYDKRKGYTEDNFSWFTSIAEILFLGPTGDAPVEGGDEADVHSHSFKNRWNHDIANHWHDSRCGHYEFGNKDLHDYTGDWDDTCNTCGRFRTPHYEHTATDYWLFDENSHWKAATCECFGKTFEKAAHTYNDMGICTVCGQVDVYDITGGKLTVQAENTELLTRPGADPLLPDASKPAVVVQDNDKASGGKVVLMNQAYTKSLSKERDVMSHISFRVKPEKTGGYYVWLKMYAPSAGGAVNVFIEDDLKNDDYYWSQSVNANDLSISGDFGDFVWVRLSTTYDWTKGQTYRLNFRAKSALIRLDEIYITTDANDPYPHVHTYNEKYSMGEDGHWFEATCGCEGRIRGMAAHEYADHRDETCEACGYRRELCDVHDYDANNICKVCGNSKPINTVDGKLSVQAEDTKLLTEPGADILLPDIEKGAVTVQNITGVGGGKAVLVNQRFTASTSKGSPAHSSFIVVPDVTGDYEVWVKAYAPTVNTQIAMFVADEEATDSNYRKQTSGVASTYGVFSDMVWIKLDNTYRWQAGEEYMIRFRGVDSLVRVDEFYVTCDPEDPYVHRHTFAEEWTTSDTHHWHEATCGCQDITTAKEAHKFDGRTDTTCNTCGYTRVLHLTHTYGADDRCTECGRIKPFTIGDNGITVQAEDVNLLTEAGSDPLFTEAPVKLESKTNYSGGKAVLMNKRYTNSTSVDINSAAHISFDVTPEKSGTYYIWVKMYNTGDDISAYVEDAVNTDTDYYQQRPEAGNCSTRGNFNTLVWMCLKNPYQWEAGETYQVALRSYATLVRVDEFYITSSSTENPGDSAHTHTYESEWTTNDTHHWHAADCGCVNEMKDYAPHTNENGFCTVCRKPDPNWREEEDDDGDGAIQLPDYDVG